MKTILNITANSQTKPFGKRKWQFFLLVALVLCHSLDAQNTGELNYFNLILPDSSLVSYKLTDGINIHFQDSTIVVNGLNYYMENIVKYYFSAHTNYTVLVSASPDEGGTVSGGGDFFSEDTCTVTAMPNEGYDFWCWTEGGRAVSTEASYSFTLSGPRNLMALFRLVSTNDVIIFSDPNVEMVCLEYWDTDGDGYLSYDEAATVIDLGYVFEGNTNITNFDELQYFTGLTSIGSYAFYNCSGLTSFVLPSSVTTIGNYAFSNCTSLTGDLVIPNTITTIGERAFYRCSGFNGSITIGENVISIGHYAFSECSNITTLNYNAINSNASNAYADFGWLERCYALHTLNIGEQVQVIPDNAFYGYNLNFTGTLTIPNSVTTIGENAFGNNGFTGTLTIGENVESIGNQAFYNCSSITSMYCLVETPTTLGEDVFYNINQNIPVYVPCDAVELYENAVWGGFNNFNGICGGTVTVTANPAEGGIVTGGGFYEGGQYCTVTAMANEGYVFVNWTKSGVIVSTNSEYTSLVVGDATLMANFVQDGNIVFADANVKSICVANWDTNGDGELSYAEAASVTDLGTYFYYNSNITTFDELQYFIGLSSIGNNAFYYCRSLTSIVLPSSVTAIGNYAFYYCTSLTGELVIPETVTAIGNYAFYNCYGLTFVDLPSFMKTIGSSAFYNCYGLTSIALPGSLTTIGSSVFYYCYGLTSIVLPNSLTTIGDYAFYYCTGLTGELVIPESVTTIGNYAFRNCNGLISMVLPNSLMTIGNYAFYNCSGLMGELVIPEMVTTIGDYAFYYCTNLQSITSLAIIPSGIGNYTFYGLYGKPLIVPCDAVGTYQNADYWSSFTNILGMCGGTVTVEANPTEGGTVTGGGYFDSGAQCTVTAIANEGFTFANWTQNGAIVSTSAEYSFYVMGDATLVANFVQDGNIVFADANVKSICVANWDTNNDGELSYAEAASVTDLSYYFQYNSDLTSFDELQYFVGLTSIGDYAFYYCSGLTSFVLPNTVTTIGEGAFGECYALTSIVLPSSLTTIGEAFYYCENVQSITSLAITPPNIGYYTFYGLYDKQLIVPCNAVETYQNADYWSSFTNILGMCGGTVTVGVNLTEGGTVTGGGYYDSGAQCTVTAIANEGFTFANWTQNGAIVSASAEYSFYVMGDVTLVANFVQDGNIIFADANVKSICVANWDTNNDGELSYAEAASVTDLGYYFQYNSDITSFDELQYFIGLTSIGDYAFYYCSGLTSFVLPNTVTTISEGAFGECYALTSIVLPSSVTTIGYSAFYYCTGLTGELVIPETVTTMGNYAFYYCSNLQLITSLAVIPPSIGDYTFYGLYDKSLMVPCDVVETYQNADYWSYFTNIQGLCPGTITVEANPTEGGTVTGGGYYEGGATCTLTAIANTGYTFINWKENGSIVSYDATYSFIVSGNRNLVAHFVEEGSMCNIVFDLYDSYGDGWNGNYLVVDYGNGTSEQLTFTNGSSVSYPREVATGSNVALSWISGNYTSECSFDISFENGIQIYHGANLSSSFQYEFILDCEAVFVQYTISAVANPEEGGIVDGAGTYDIGTTCTLTATPNSGYYFLNWTENGEVVSTEPTYSFIVTNNRDLVANFLEGDICAITFDLYDSYGDGYTGNYLVVSYGDVTEQLTVISGYYASHTLYIPNGSHVFLTWVLGSYPEDCSFTISYSNGDIIYQGENLNSTFMFDFYVNCDGLFEITQTITLSQGWNWFSTYLDITLDDLKDALTEALPSSSIKIKSQSNGSTSYNGNTWRGALNSLDVSQMYMISVSTDCEITLTGTPINPAEYSVTISNGVNWIAFPLSQSMTLSNAFAGFAVSGDKVKSQTTTGNYNGSLWRPSFSLEPGKGYMYISNTQGTRTFTFPASAK